MFVVVIVCIIVIIDCIELETLRSLYQLEFMVLQSGYWWSQVLHCI